MSAPVDDASSLEGFRLSPQQSRLHALSGADAWWPFTARALFAVRGAVDSGRLKAAAREVVGSCEVLRTVLRQFPGTSDPVQVVLEEPEFSFQEIDLSDRTAVEQEAECQAIFQRGLVQPADPTVAPSLSLARNGRIRSRTV